MVYLSSYTLYDNIFSWFRIDRKRFFWVARAETSITQSRGHELYVEDSSTPLGLLSIHRSCHTVNHKKHPHKCFHFNLSWPSWPLVEKRWAQTNQECKSQQVMENARTAPICMCVDAAGRGICFSKKAPPGKIWGLSLYSVDVLSCWDLAFHVLRSKVILSGPRKDKRDPDQAHFIL